MHPLAVVPFTTFVSLLLPSMVSRASCSDPRHCFTDLCTYPGNVVELTIVIGNSGTDLLGEITVRIDALHIVNAEKFATPAVGSEVSIGPRSQEYSQGDRLVGLTREPPNVAWPLFKFDGVLVRCLAGPTDLTLTVDQVQEVVRSGDCDAGPPLPRPLNSCDDTPESCTSGANATPLALALLLALRTTLRRPRHSPKTKPNPLLTTMGSNP